MRAVSKIAVGVLLSLPPLAWARAATSTANMTVGIQITAACNVSVTNINFGAQPATVLTAALTSTPAMGGLFSYTCSPGTPAPALTANAGLHNLAGNRMIGGVSGAFLHYSLAIPAIPAFTGTLSTAQITATIPIQSPLPTVDTYTDTVILTLSY